LKDHGRPRHGSVDEFFTKKYLTLACGEQAGKDSQKGGLARSGTADDDEDLTIPQFQVHAFQNADFAALGVGKTAPHPGQAIQGLGDAIDHGFSSVQAQAARGEIVKPAPEEAVDHHHIEGHDTDPEGDRIQIPGSGGQGDIGTKACSH